MASKSPQKHILLIVFPDENQLYDLYLIIIKKSWSLLITFACSPMLNNIRPTLDTPTPDLKIETFWFCRNLLRVYCFCHDISFCRWLIFMHEAIKVSICQKNINCMCLAIHLLMTFRRWFIFYFTESFLRV